GEEVAVWDDVDELIDLCRRSMADAPWSRSIREKGMRRTLAEHTFDHRIEEVETLWP
ncbi:MAG: glycosyltransferase, partial [Brachybacterium sp.]|nr:glycosyltransferase [Brachybacterium sp.]